MKKSKGFREITDRVYSITASILSFIIGMAFLIASAMTKDDLWCGALIFLGSACCAVGLSMLFDRDHKFILAKGYHDDHDHRA